MVDAGCQLGTQLEPWLPHSLAAGLQEHASQENKAGVWHFYDLVSEITEHSFLYTLLAITVIKFYLGSME